jgi:Cu/Ag efflux protein CusF
MERAFTQIRKALYPGQDEAKPLSGLPLNKPPVKPTLIPLVCILNLACASGSKPPAEKHYPLTGKVVSVNAKEQTAAVDAAAIPNFMEAMTMDYPIESKAEFEALHAGDQITATVDVSADGVYTLTHIKTRSAAKK